VDESGRQESSRPHAGWPHLGWGAGMKRFWTSFIVTLLIEIAFFWLGGWNFEYERTVGNALMAFSAFWIAFCVGAINR